MRRWVCRSCGQFGPWQDGYWGLDLLSNGKKFHAVNCTKAAVAFVEIESKNPKPQVVREEIVAFMEIKSITTPKPRSRWLQRILGARSS